LSAQARERLVLLALSEICGLGLIDRLWADRSVRAVVVNRPDAVFVERNGALEPAPEQFRDREHLLDIVARLTRLPPSGIAEFRLRDGSEGMLVVPPAAPSGPVLILRRGEPGSATFDRLIASEMLDRAIADLLRIAVRCRLDVVIAGPEGSGKTALLAAIARDFGDAARVVAVARHREFRWPSPSKVELVAPPEGEGTAPLSALLAAGVRLRPDLLLVDSVRPSELTALAKALSRGERATIAAVSDADAGAFEGQADLSIRLGRTRDGLFRVISVKDSSGARLFVHESGRFRRGTAEPAFAGLVRDAGYGEALSTALR
jgi:pilus assembly protein CpaF